MSAGFFVAAAIIAAIVYFALRKDKAPPIPAASMPRPGILYGYYGDAPGQAAEVVDHTNLYFAAPWGGLDQMAANILDARRLGLRNLVLAVDADRGSVDLTTETCRAWLRMLRGSGCLEAMNVLGLYWRDEPNLENPAAGLAVLSDERVRAQNASLRVMLATEFPELGKVGMWTIMADRPDLPGLDDWDCVGGDDYPRGAAVLEPNRLIDRIRKGKRPDAGLILVPSPLLENPVMDPTPFEQYAYAVPDVRVIMPFLWRDGWEGNRPGIRSSTARDAYRALGQRLLSA